MSARIVKVKDSIGVVIVTYGHEDVIGDLMRALNGQKKKGDKIVVIDNHPQHLSAQNLDVKRFADKVAISENNGFSGGCRTGAQMLIDEVDLLFFINPDTHPDENVLNEMRNGSKVGYDAWMSLLTLPNQEVNSAGTIVHISGLSWAGGYGKSIEDYGKNKDLSALSGACMIVRTDVWQESRGMEDTYFMYYEDTDFTSRLFLSGSRLGLIPSAHVGHDYEFDKGVYKWFYLERNRYLYIMRIWPWQVILMLSPVLLVSEFGLVAISVLQKRFKLKVSSNWAALMLLPWALKTRKSIQRTRTISVYKFFLSLEPELNTPLLGVLAKSRIINAGFRGYYKIALFFLSVFTLRKTN